MARWVNPGHLRSSGISSVKFQRDRKTLQRSATDGVAKGGTVQTLSPKEHIGRRDRL
jgi:hypothetical protein